MVWEIGTGFAAGIILIIFLCWLFKAKMKWYIRLPLSSALGFVILFAFNLLTLIVLPVNPLNAFLIGFLGLPGLALVILIATVL